MLQRRILSVFLAACLAGCAVFVLPASAQQVTPSESSSSNEVADAVMVGLIITVVGVLLWLGWKTDRDRARSKRGADADTTDLDQAWVASLNEDQSKDDHLARRELPPSWAQGLGLRF